MNERKKIQVQVSSEIHRTLMSISQAQRGQFINMALHNYMESEDGQKLLKQFAKHQPDMQKLKEELPGTKHQESTGKLNSIMGDFD